MTDIPEWVMKAAKHTWILAGGYSKRANTPVHIIARAIMEARDKAMEDAAKYHDDEIEGLQNQIAENNAYARRLGSPCNTKANQYCRDLQVTHRLSAEAIRAMKSTGRAAMVLTDGEDGL